MIKVFGHKSPDTDATGSPVIWAWYLSEVKGLPARPVLLGEPNTEAAFVLDHWGIERPEIITALAGGEDVVVVDTNNPAELPDGIHEANIIAIIDHHMLAGGLKTRQPIEITIRPLACTATVMHDLIGSDLARAPRHIKGVMLSCILSDTLEFRSPTTTDHDRQVAEDLAADLGLDIPGYAARMFQAKSDVSAFSDAELLQMDSKQYEVGGKKLRVSVLETTSPQILLDRKDGLIAAMPAVQAADGSDETLLFVVDILKGESTLLLPNDVVRHVAKATFGVAAAGDAVLLPGIVSRKKQIVPVLKV